MLASYDVSVAVEYLSHCGAPVVAANVEWAVAVESWFLAASLGSVVADASRPSPVWKQTVLRLAKRGVQRWIGVQNEAHGVAPGVQDVIQQYSSQLGTLGAPELAHRLMQSVLRKSNSKARRWCQRFRARWRLRRGTLKPRAVFEPGEIQKKARGAPAVCIC